MALATEGVNSVQEWTPPQFFDLSITEDQSRVQTLIAEMPHTRVHDPLPLVAQALCEYEHPELKGKPDKQVDYIEDITKQGDDYGTWVYYPWLGTLSHFPPKDQYRQLRTSRDRMFTSEDEQEKLFTKKVAFVGLSVGSKVLRAFAEGSVGGKYFLFEPDHLEPTNLNRIDAGFPSIGESKISIAAKFTSEKDPWIEQVHVTEGLTTGNAQLLDEVDLVIEEADSLSAKAVARLQAEKNGTPLIMAADIHNKSVIDVERYDLDDGTKIMFNGRLKRNEILDIAAGGLTPAENSRFMLKHQGVRHLSVRMMQSAMLMGAKLGGLPQYGSTATKGGADIVFAAREILLGRDIASGRFVDDPRETFRLKRFETSPVIGARTAIQLLKHMRSL